MNQLERALLGFLGGLVATASVAWIAFQIQQEQIAPAVLFPLFVGAVLGGTILALGRISGLANRRLAVAAAVSWGLIAVVAQDYLGHRYRLRMFETEVAGGHPLAAAMVSERDLRPTFADHLAARIRDQPLWWTLDLLLTAAAAGGVAALGTRPPAALSSAAEGTGNNSTGAPGGTGPNAAD
jgi:hypothetical protein